LKDAAAQFERALKVNPENLVAEVNLECNRNLQADRRTTVQMSRSIEDRFGRYRNWDQVMNENGPFDEPNFCFEQGRIFVRNGNLRQAAAQFSRVVALTPENLAARILLAQIGVVGQFPKEALKVVAGIHADAKVLGLGRTNFADVLAVETTAHLALGDVPGAETVVRNTLNRYPGDEDLLATAATAYMNFGCYSNAVGILDEHLKITPDNAFLLAHKGFACLQLNAFFQAIPPLTRVLTLETNSTSDLYYSALLNRAIAYLKSEQYDDARRDYEALQKAFPTSHKIYFGLGEIAFRRHETNEAIRNYQLYLANTRTNTTEASNVVARLTELKRGT
jgi:tetratricopeptide (TPR) repeat protein